MVFKWPNQQSGFTLIEIVVALVIVAISILAISGSMAQSTQVTSELEKRLLASWVASNQLAEIRYNSKIDRIQTGSKSKIIKMGGHRWRARVRTTETDSDNVFLVRVKVESDRANDDGSSVLLTTAVAKF